MIPDAVLEARKDFDAALEGLKTNKKRKLVEESTIEATVATLRRRMLEAAHEDIEANEEQKPALAKLKMLPFLLQELQVRDMHDYFLDGGILEAVRIWLEPFPDGSLPNMNIREQLLGALLSLPIEKDHLKESGIGKIVMFYAKLPREDQKIKRIAMELINLWSRPIIGTTINYKDLSRFDFDIPKLAKESKTFQNESNRARIPRAGGFDFTRRPQSRYTGSTRRRPKSAQIKKIEGHIQRLERKK